MTTDKELKRLEKKWKKSRWYSPKGKNVMKKAYKHYYDNLDMNYDVQEYFDNIRAACRTLADVLEEMRDMDISVEVNKEVVKKK